MCCASTSFGSCVQELVLFRCCVWVQEDRAGSAQILLMTFGVAREARPHSHGWVPWGTLGAWRFRAVPASIALLM